MTKFEEEFNYLIELSGKVLIGQVDAKAFEKNRIAFFEKYETDQQQALPKTVEDFQGELEDLIDDILDDYISDLPFDGKKYKFIEKYAPQALPVVPECVAEFIKKHRGKKSILGVLNKIYNYRNGYPKIYEWVFHNEENQELFALAFITGKYEVEKPQLFRLKLKNATISNYYLWLNNATGKVFVDKKFLDWTNHNNVKNTFTEQEIAKISGGAFVNNEAFELAPVEDGE